VARPIRELLFLKSRLDRYGGYRFDNTMTWRPGSCLAVSALMHALVLMIPLAIMTFPFHLLSPKDDVLEVSLVGAAAQDKGSAQVQSPAKGQALEKVDKEASQQTTDEVKKQDARAEEAMSFVTDRKVAASYLDRLKTKIFLVWKYPEEAIQIGQQGDVSISFVLNSKGELISIGVLKGSGSRSLDKASVTAVRQANPFGPLPEDMSNEPLKITGHFRYVLD
jgi:TonB family protein